MTRSKRGLILGACVLLTVALGCGDDAGSDLLASGSECMRDEECASGLCEYAGGGRECATPCADEDECPGSLGCSRTHRALGTYCLPLCLKDEDDTLASDGLACVEGAYVVCDDVPDGSHCRACGCDARSYCSDDNACVPVADEGEACTHNEGCASGNCSAARFDSSSEQGDPVGECVEEPGMICTDDSACRCVPIGAQTICAAFCEDDQECAADETCLGNLETHIGYCHQDCSEGQACPAGQTCRSYGEPTTLNPRFAACDPS